ncbi:hypothetical protein MG293_002322 [Ovis ammon polii]|uniref:Uncharacterized protein n=1 Tax=Ovis ammon polii TaxID=230172 RepID=A0AAD4UJE9_OVIAM|nr:hypothetical protein MG293_002322 [Ovis ammon polii]KAI4576030.1 hypothetical protein MJT46_001865 [Ovis ammon polii x Ovis aries]
MAPSPRTGSRQDATALPSMSSTFWAFMILASLLIAYCIVAKAEDELTGSDLLGDERPLTLQNPADTHGLWCLGPMTHRLVDAAPALSLETQWWDWVSCSASETSAYWSA